MKPNTDSKKLSLAVLFGGRCVEHEISIISALQLIKALDDRKYELVPVYIAPDGVWYTGDLLLNRNLYRSFAKHTSELSKVTLLPQPGQRGLKRLDGTGYINVDVYFPVFHGEFGEDGCIQGLFDLAEVNYTGFGLTESAIAMNKNLCKLALSAAGIPVLPGHVVRKFEYLKAPEKIEKDLSSLDWAKFPLFVKPNNRGSSVGIAKVDNLSEFKKALLNVFKYDLEAIIEPFLADMFEMNVAVLDIDPAITSVLEIPHAEDGVLSYEDKYMRSGSKKSGDSEGMASLTRSINPKDLASELKEEVSSMALKAFQTLGASGNTRIDFMHDNSTEKVYLNETNALPGSLAFYLWADSEPPLLYTDLIDCMVDAAVRRGEQRASLERTIGFKAL